MLPFLVDLELPYAPDAPTDYEPRDLISYALEASDYWADLALRWLDQGAPTEGLHDALFQVETQSARPQSVRHHARRLRRGR